MDAWYFTLPALVIIGREILISALREWMAELGKRGVVAVSIWGKVKTAAQMLSIIALLSRYNETVINIGYGLMYIATALTVSSMVSYLWAATQAMNSDSE
jgi:CDP-diacylglycerol--glycerol-3-phosphate 3-phosphatidyltransferase